jgi:hypothetical protein
MSVSAIGALERSARRAPYRETVSLLAEGLGLSVAEQAELEAAAASARGRSRINRSGPGAGQQFAATAYVFRRARKRGRAHQRAAIDASPRHDYGFGRCGQNERCFGSRPGMPDRAVPGRLVR